MIFLNKKFLFFLPIMIHFLNLHGMNLIRQQKAKSPSSRIIKEKSELLYNNISTLSLQQMQQLVNEGARVNYGQYDYGKITKMPILVRTLFSTDKESCFKKIYFLLEHGADINHPYTNIKCIDELGPTAPNKLRTVTPLKIAMIRNDLPLIDLLLFYKPQNKHIHTLIEKNNIEMARLFIESGNLTADEYYCCAAQSLIDKKIEMAALFIKPYIPAQAAVILCRYLKETTKTKTDLAEINLLMQQFNDLDDGDLANLKRYIYKTQAQRKRPFRDNDYLIAISIRLQKANIKKAAPLVKVYEPANKAFFLFDKLHATYHQIEDREDVLYLMEELNNLTEKEFSELISYLN